ncbi:MAG: Ig-like domain-containing protein, partial [Maribacter sp.]
MGNITFIKKYGSIVHYFRSFITFFICISLALQVFAFDSKQQIPPNFNFKFENNEADIDDDDDGILDVVEDLNEDGDNDPATNPTDTDGDGIPNYLDIDADGDGLLDNYEAQRTISFVAFSGVDANGNGLDDAYEGSYGFGIVPINSDRAALPDYIDPDSDIDGIRDNIEAQPYLDYVAPSGIDANQNGLDDAYEGSFGFGIIPINSDADQYPDFRDFDSDNDGIKDKVEAQTSEGYIPPIGDNDQNGIDDAYEAGLSPIDTDGDGIPDFHDIDSDNDGILDNIEAQTVAGYIAPSGVDGNRDGLDNAYGGDGLTPINSDSDTNPDYRDIDSDNDGIPDNIEGQTTAGYISPSGNDSDNDGLDDAYEGTGNQGVAPVNTDGTDAVDYLDDDSDNDLVPDNNEGNDFNFDGIPDQAFTGVDTDGDGLDDGYEGTDVNDGYDVNDEIEDPATDLPDTDGTEDVNYRDLDDDGDGITTPDEDVNMNGDPTDDDSDGDGTPDYLDPIGNNDVLDVIDDNVSTPVDTPLDIDILDNDLGIPTDGTLTTTEPTNGTLVVNDNGTPDDITDDTVTYTPNDGFEGTDTFEYTVCEADGTTCDTATVTI